jgi:hypothetical protein
VGAIPDDSEEHQTSAPVAFFRSPVREPEKLLGQAERFRHVPRAIPVRVLIRVHHSNSLLSKPCANLIYCANKKYEDQKDYRNYPRIAQNARVSQG